MERLVKIVKKLMDLGSFYTIVAKCFREGSKKERNKELDMKNILINLFTLAISVKVGVKVGESSNGTMARFTMESGRTIVKLVAESGRAPMIFPTSESGKTTQLKASAS